MKRLKIHELFKGYDDVYIPDTVSTDTPLSIALSDKEIKEPSLLFITEKVGNEDAVFDAGELTARPVAVVVSKAQRVIDGGIPIIRVGRVRAALSFALSNSYDIEYGRLKFIGVTGTNGKTTTATLIHHILRDAGYKAGFIGTGKIVSGTQTLCDSTYSMTTPDPTVLYPAIAKMQEDGCTYIVMEVSSHSIALGKIAPIKFEYSIFTNLDDDHLDFHKTKEDYFNTKMQLFKSSRAGLFNFDDEYSRRGYSLAECEKSSFGIIRQGDAYATEIEVGISDSSFFYREKDLIARVKTNLPGAFNVYNSIAALRCTIDLGIKPCIAKRSLEGIRGIEGRMEIIKGDITVIIDYAHTPSAFYNCLKTVKQSVNAQQNAILVFGCGGNRDAFKRPIFGKYDEMLADTVVITEDNSREEELDKIISDITSGMSKRTHKIIKDRASAIEYAVSTASPGDVVLIVGKGHEKYKITKDGYLPFDERKIVLSALERMGRHCESQA